MKKRKNNFNLLFNINVRLAFNKKSIFTLVISLILLIVYLFFIVYNSYDKESYLLAFKDIHTVYLKEGLFVVNIINFLLILVFITVLYVNSDRFDSMYVSYIPRKTISKSRMWALIYLETAIAIIEFLSLMLPAFIIYPLFKIELKNIYIFIYILFLGLLQIGITLLLLSIGNNNFVPILGFLFSFILQVISFGFKEDLDYINYLIPLNYTNYECPIIGLFLIVLGISIYNMKYNVKNIN